MRSRAILLAAAIFAVASVPVAAQQQPTGALMVNVKDKTSGQPLSGAQVSIQGTRLGGITNEQGRYLLPAAPVGTHTVTVTFLGFSEIRQSDVAITAGQTTTLEIGMEQSVLSLEQIVATGVTDPTAGIKVPFTVAQVRQEQLQVPSVNSALASIQGKVSGVNIVRASGKPGAGVNIVLRSPTAFEESNSPLIVVDGVVIARDLNGTTADIEALDIENVEIIKGAAAASLYGSRASSGVIAITTRRGRDVPRNQTRITSRTEFGKDFVGNKIPVTHAHQYRMNAAGTALVNAAGRDTTWAGRSSRTVALHGGNARMLDQAYPGPIYDNVGAVFQPNQFLSQNFTLSQNTDNTTFLIGLTRYDQAGALTNNDGFLRHVGRFSLDHRVGQKISFSITGNHSRTWEDEISGDPYEEAFNYPAYVDLTQKGPDGQYLMLPDSTVEIENPLWREGSRDNYTSRIRTQGSANIRYSPLTWMMFDAQLSYDRADTKGQVYVPKGVIIDVEDGEESSGRLLIEHQENNAFNGAFGINFNRQFGQLNSRLSLRGTVEKETRESFSADGRDFIVVGIRDLSNTRTLFDMGSGTTDVRANGLIADLGLDFKDRYIGSFLIRRDGSSLFGPEERWHTYKRASAAWIISREPWFNLPLINELKFRYALGEAGGRPSFTDQYETWGISRTSGPTRSTAGNPFLKPHFTREHDIGMDIIALNNRLQLELVYATQDSKDNIIIIPATVITGYNSVTVNAARMKGRTYEATLTAYPVRTRDITWSVNAVADHSENELVEWGRACFYGSNANREHEYTCAGQQMGDFWTLRTIRGSNELPSWLQSRADEFVVNNEGYLVWVGKDGNGVVNSWRDGIAIANNAEKCNGSRALASVSGGCGWGSSFSANGITYRWGEPFRAWNEETNEPLRIHSGKSLPDLQFGFGSNFRYKGLSAYVGMRGQLGGNVYAGSRQELYDNLRHADLDQTGKPDELKKPLDYYQRGLADGNDNWIDLFVEDGTHLKLSEARVSYRFTRDQLGSFLGRAAPSELTFGLNGRNLFTLDRFTGADPEAGQPLSRVEGLGYPHLRTLTATVDITF